MLGKNVLITGSTGMLGKSLSSYFPNADCLNGKSHLDLTDLSEVKKYFKDKSYSTIIHAAAFTNLDYCESNENNCRKLHSEVIEVLSDVCEKLIYISTNPIESKKIYYLTKQEGEKRTLLLNKNNLVIRTNIYGKGGLVEWMVYNLNRNNEINGYVNSLFNPVHVNQLSRLIKNELMNSSGLVSVAGNFHLSKYDFLKIASYYLNLDGSLITPIQLTEPNDLIINQIDFKNELHEGLLFLKEDYHNNGN